MDNMSFNFPSPPTTAAPSLRYRPLPLATHGRGGRAVQSDPISMEVTEFSQHLSQISFKIALKYYWHQSFYVNMVVGLFSLLSLLVSTFCDSTVEKPTLLLVDLLVFRSRSLSLSQADNSKTEKATSNHQTLVLVVEAPKVHILV
jgi:hypothetical protein